MATRSGTSEQISDCAIAEAIAEETKRPIEEVRRLYEQELEQLAHEAKITQFLSVLAGRRVKEKLKH